MDSTSVIIAFSGSYVVYLNGADGVTFRYLTIKNTATFDFQAVHFENGATNNMLFHNVLQASASTYTSSYYSVVYSYYSGDHDNSFIGNRILNGGTGIYLNQNGNALIQDNNRNVYDSIQSEQSNRPTHCKDPN